MCYAALKSASALVDSTSEVHDEMYVYIDRYWLGSQEKGNGKRDGWLLDREPARHRRTLIESRHGQSAPILPAHYEHIGTCRERYYIGEISKAKYQAARHSSRFNEQRGNLRVPADM